MAFQALMFTQDRTLVPTMTRLFDSIEIKVQACANASMAVERLKRERFQAVLVDCEEPRCAEDILGAAKTAVLNAHAVRLGVVDHSVPLKEAFRMGATLVIEKPISTPTAHRAVRATQALIVREQRRYFRCPVDIPVLITAPKLGAVRGHIHNLSQEGMGVSVAQQLEVASSVNWRFVLPDLDCSIEGVGQVVWTGMKDRAGIKLTSMSKAVQEQLRTWLNAQFESMGIRLSSIQ